LPGWLAEIIRPPASITPSRIITYTGSSTNRAHAAMRGVVRTVAGAAVGERNAILYWGACRAAEAARAGAIDASFIADALALAAGQAGLSRSEAVRTIKSAFRTGGRT